MVLDWSVCKFDTEAENALRTAVEDMISPGLERASLTLPALDVSSALAG